jgi:hypothetical protein
MGNQKIYSLKAPLRFRFKTKFIERIRDEYDPNFEVGEFYLPIPP